MLMVGLLMNFIYVDFFLYIIKKLILVLRLNLKDFVYVKSEFIIIDKGKGMVFIILFLRICM